MSLTDAVDKMKQATRNYAKRQITWFKHMQATWVDVDSELDTAKNQIIEEFGEYRK